MFRTLWKHRDRPPMGSRVWFKTWAKRLCQLPRLCLHYHSQWQLRLHGARIDPSAVFVDPGLITGHKRDLEVGAESFVGRVRISVHASIRIGSRVCLNDGVQLLTASHDIRDPQWPSVAKPICIEDYAWIATNAMILPGITIGRGAVVGAGAVVSRDVPANAVATGNPAVVKLNQRSPDLSYNPTAGLAFFTAWRALTQEKL
jgi:acetyltransferase-like isoleucine patch superfamily enzyme